MDVRPRETAVRHLMSIRNEATWTAAWKMEEAWDLALERQLPTARLQRRKHLQEGRGSLGIISP